MTPSPPSMVKDHTFALFNFGTLPFKVWFDLILLYYFLQSVVVTFKYPPKHLSDNLDTKVIVPEFLCYTYRRLYLSFTRQKERKTDGDLRVSDQVSLPLDLHGFWPSTWVNLATFPLRRMGRISCIRGEIFAWIWVKSDFRSLSYFEDSVLIPEV